MEYLKALKLNYEALLVVAMVNLRNYMNNSVGVAEHPNIIASMDGLVEEIAAAQEKLAVVEDLLEKTAE
tara:strand:+ start:138 stop:344 length:207 start_codon:yes stop_codon:yes gene_type:complete